MLKIKKIKLLAISIAIVATVLVFYINKIPSEQITYKINSAKYLINRYILQQDYLTATTTTNLKFKFKTPDAVGRTIYKRQYYEPDVTLAALTKIPFEDNDIIIDVGANIGWYAINLNANTPASTKIFAFEPDPLNFKLLTTNLKLNNSNKVTAVPLALAERTGKQFLYQYSDKNLGRHSLLPEHSNQAKVAIETIRLDEFVKINELDPSNIKLLKIDVEGYEYQVLAGCQSLLPYITYIIHEFSPETMQKHHIDPKQLVELLETHGFEPFIISNNDIKLINKEQLLKLTDGVNLFWQKQINV